MLSAPRRSAAIPNADGSLALYTVETYCFETHQRTREIRLFEIASKKSSLVSGEPNASEPHWLENEILHLRESENGSTQLLIASPNEPTTSCVAGTVPGSISGLKLKQLEPGKVAVMCNGKATRRGSLCGTETTPEKHHTGMLYESLMVRHWNAYTTPDTNALWYGILQLSGTEDGGRYSLSPLVNALKGTGLESPLPPWPNSTHYDISKDGIIFVAKDPNLDPAFNTKTDFYFLSIPNFASATSSAPRKVTVSGLEGASSSPVFAPDGETAAYLQVRENGAEADQNRVILVEGCNTEEITARELFTSEDGNGLWDLSPSRVVWSNSGEYLYLITEDAARTLIFKADSQTAPTTTTLPEPITDEGEVTDFYPLRSNSSQLLVSSNSRIENSLWSILDPEAPSKTVVLSSNTNHGAVVGLSPAQASSIWYTGSNNHKIHALLFTPSTFDPSSDSDRTYPLLYFIHGGPQHACRDSWSTEYNPAVFAEQGYVVVAPNITGSTGYGQAFTDAVTHNWGGSTYDDLVAGFDYIHANLPYVDTDRAVAIGPSFGGYMINWLHGHALGARFKALVCHAGYFSTVSGLPATEEQFFVMHDFGGPLSNLSAREVYDRWDPARYTANWATPTLVVHNGMDYRVPISEGLATFNVLQSRGVESRFLTFPDEGHDMAGEENSRVWHAVVLNWCNRFVGLPPAGEDMKVQSRGWGERG
jgi:dipeptidyl aminopeptidase/acylaminoacyl peptidase